MKRRACFALALAGQLLAFAACSAPPPTGNAAGAASAVPVLMYHEISTRERPPGQTVIALDRFKQQMQYLADNGYSTLSVGGLVEFLQGKPVPQRSLVLTFDDGWKSVRDAVPILKAHGFKASFFIITGCADGRFGPDYLSWDEIRSIAADPLFEIGSHSVTHPWDPADDLVAWARGAPAGKSMKDARFELVESRKRLESNLRRPIRCWAWPCGRYTDRLIQEAREAGYEAMMTTVEEPNISGLSPLEIRRFYVSGEWDIPQFARFLEQSMAGATAKQIGSVR